MPPTRAPVRTSALVTVLLLLTSGCTVLDDLAAPSAGAGPSTAASTTPPSDAPVGGAGAGGSRPDAAPTGGPSGGAAPSGADVTGDGDAAASDGRRQVISGQFDPDLGAEISGVAAAQDVEGLWLVDDDPGTDLVHLVALDGTTLGTVRLAGVAFANAEDLAVGPCPEGGGSCVHVGDIGDNRGSRRAVTVVAFPEAALAGAAVGAVVEVTPTVTGLRWADGPRDAEALVVTRDGTVVVLDKTPDVAAIGVAAPGADALVTVAQWTLPPAPSLSLAALVGNTVTAADVTPGGDALVVRTYDLVLLLEPPGGVVDAAALATVDDWSVTEVTRVPGELQGEAVTVLADGRVVTVAEGSTAITVTRPG